MPKFKLFHPCFEYVEGHDSEIIVERDNTNNYGRTKVKYGIAVDGQMEVCPRCGGHGVHDRIDLDTSKLLDSMIEDGDQDGVDTS